MPTVTLGDFGSIWDAITQTGPFDICYGNDCVTAPGWGSWTALGLFFAEFVFWIFVARTALRRYRVMKKKQTVEAPFPPKLEPPSL